ncbi:hypothetical protein Gpo141_00007774 [Globisporangium polare]
MLCTSDHVKQSWGPEEEAVVKKATGEPQEDCDHSTSTSSSTTSMSPADTQSSAPQDFVAVRVSRSQSLTDPRTPPMFPSPTNSNTSVGFSTSENSPTASAQPQRESNDSGPHQQPAPLVSLEQLATDPRFARRNRRSMSAEFTLSMLQQELGYPKRKSSKPNSRRDSITEKSRRTSSILEETSANDNNNLITKAVQILSSNSTESSSECSHFEPESERSTHRLSVESASKFPSGSSRSKRGSYSSNQDTHDEDDNEQEDDNEDDDNFLASRVASITGFSQDTDGVVYYEIIVKSVAHGPLSAYKVRRRYSEFRDLHRALSAIMPTSRSVNLATPSLGFGENDDEHEASISMAQTQTQAAVAPRVHHLPPLPDRGGLWAYLQFDTTPFLERRAKYFQVLLVACQSHPRARESRLLNDFLGPPPDLVALHTSVENSYVSLNRFAAPKLRLSVEAQERKQKARNISRRRSSIHRVSRPTPES